MSSGKVKCTCGWSWNKSDSSKKDMYICHECGRDNSNNMKNGGWLDNYADGGSMQEHQENYNNSSVSLPEGFVGMGNNTKGRNYSPAWGGQFEEGGEIPMAQKGYQTSKDSVAHQADKILKYEKLRGGPGGVPLPQYADPQYMGMLMNKVYPEVQKIMPKASAMETGEAMDFIFNAGWDKDNNKITKDPRAFALQEYYRQYDKSKLDKDGKWAGRKNAPYSFDQEYGSTVGKLSENQRRLLMNKGRDWYYQNINNPSPGVPSSDYNDTWYGRIWNTNDYKPFDPNNPKFTPKKQIGGNVYPVNYVPQAQNGKLTFLQPTSDKLPQGYRIPYDTPSSERAMSIGGEDGEPAYLIPSFKYGQPLDDPMGEFRKTGEHLGGPFKTWQEADEWERTVRHPAVEKGENIMFPQEKFAMGGSIPGAVGFSYARTQSPAPSNGPYAKKTMPSAQTGKKTGKAKPAVKFDPKKFAKDFNLGLTPQERAIKASVDKEAQSEDYRRWTSSAEYKNAVKAEKAARDKAILAERKANIKKSDNAKLNQWSTDIVDPSNWTRQNVADAAAGLGDKARLFPNDPDNFVDDWLNPGVMIGNMASDLGSAPLRAQQEDSYMPYATSIGLPLLVGGLEGIGANTTRQFVSNIANPFNIVPGYKSAEKTIGSGIRKALGKDIKSQAANANILPPKNILVDEAYFEPSALIRAIKKLHDTDLPSKTKLDKIVNDIEAGEGWKYSSQDIQAELESLKNAAKTEKEAAYMQYLSDEYEKGLGNQWSEISRRRDNPVFLTNQKIEDLEKTIKNYPEGNQWYGIQEYKGTRPNAEGYISDVDDYIGDPKYMLPGRRFDREAMLRDMGEDAMHSFNKMYKNQNWKPDIKDLPLNKQGGVVKSNRGQWDYPGQVTEIDQSKKGSYIDMGPDPKTGKKINTPVLAVSDTGDVKILQPGGKYKLKGTKVTEYPIAEDGIQTTTDKTTIPDGKAFLNKLKEEAKAKKKIDIREPAPTAVNDNIQNASRMAANADAVRVKDVRNSNRVAAEKAKAEAEAQKKFNALSKEEQERAMYDYYNQQQGTISEYTPDSMLSKLDQSALAPFTALKDLYQNGEVRDNLLKSIINNPETANAYDAAYLGTLGYAAAPAIGSAIAAAPAAISPYATMIGNSLATDAVIGGNTIAGLNLGNAINAGFATHGAMNIGPDIAEWAEDPTWGGAGEIAMDTLEMLPAVGPTAKTLGEGFNIAGRALGTEEGLLSNLYKLNPLSKGAAENVLPTVAETVASKPWEMQNLPGLHLQSTMENGAISKIVEPKTGLVHTEQALAIIGKESGGADKVSLIKQALGENIPKKMDYNDFRKLVQDQLVPLEQQFSIKNSDYGIESIGYTPKVQGTAFDKFSAFMNTPLNELFGKPKLLENKTIILGNANKFGRGSSAHGNPQETLGHIHFLIDSKTPNTLTVTQIQADAFQGTHRMMPKNIEDAMVKLDDAKGSKKDAYETFGDEPEKFKDVLDKADKNLNLEENHIKNFMQKSLLDKNHQERYIQELVDYAGKRGDINKVRLPTSETAVKIQNYTKDSQYELESRLANLEHRFSNSRDNIIIYNDNNGGRYIKDANSNYTYESMFGNSNSRTISEDEFNNAVKGANDEIGRLKESLKNHTPDYTEKQKTILKKYSEQPKIIKKLFGVVPELVKDVKGNTWYEFTIPKNFKEGKGEIKAFKQGGTIKDNNRLRQEQKGLVNLDQLTNFTNYNKPQPGGWLDKYN